MDGDSLTMFPVEQRDMPEHRTATPANSGTHRVELLDATGRVLHSERTDLHATGTDGVRTFLLWVPAASLSGEPTSIRIGAPARSYTRTIQHQR